MENIKVDSIDDFKKQMLSSQDIQKAFQTDPVAATNKLEENSPLETDVWIYRMVVFSLGATILLIVIGVIILIGKGEIKDDKTVPTILTAIGSAAIGALAGLLAPSPKPAKL